MAERHRDGQMYKGWVQSEHSCHFSNFTGEYEQNYTQISSVLFSFLFRFSFSVFPSSSFSLAFTTECTFTLCTLTPGSENPTFMRFEMPWLDSTDMSDYMLKYLLTVSQPARGEAVTVCGRVQRRRISTTMAKHFMFYTLLNLVRMAETFRTWRCDTLHVTYYRRSRSEASLNSSWSSWSARKELLWHTWESSSIALDHQKYHDIYCTAGQFVWIRTQCCLEQFW